MANAVVERLLEQSQFVVQGAVSRVGASTLKSLAPSERTLVVKIEEILHGPAAFTDHLGREITIYSPNPQGLAKGKQAIFFTRSWLYGENLAVAEVGRVDMPDQGRTRDEIAAANQAIQDRRLLERISKAELVIGGQVVDTKPAPPEGRRKIQTEHNPDWWVADIKVSSVEKGRPAPGPVQILFPHSMDEMWIDAPKFQRSQQGVWILQRDQQEKGWPVLRVPGLTALEPIDFQPLNQLERIRRLIGQQK